MRSSLAVGLLLVSAGAGALALAGCATSMGSAARGERVVVAVDAPMQTSTQTQTSSEVVVSEPIVPPVAQDPAPGRRRLSQTVTLGQGTSEPVYAPAPQQPSAPGGANVTVNNNVTVVNQQPAVYGGYGYGYGYGGRGYGVSGARDGHGAGTSSSRSAWAPNGWEGAQRTAAPGRTPGVGGNWAPAPSFGPASMR